MNADLSRPRPAGQEESSPLLPFAERELPAGRHQFHKERLMAQIHEDLRAADTTTTGPARTGSRARSSRNPFLRRSFLVPVAGFALAGALAVGFFSYVDRGAPDGYGSTIATGPALTTRIGTADPKGATQLLDRISLASFATGSGPAVRPDQFIYIGSKTATTYVKTVEDKSTLVSQQLHMRHEWNSPDGAKGWLIEPGNTGPKGVSLDRRVVNGQAVAPYLNAPSYDYLAALPTDPDVLLRRIYEETKGMGHGPRPGGLHHDRRPAALQLPAGRAHGRALQGGGEDPRRGDGGRGGRRHGPQRHRGRPARRVLGRARRVDLRPADPRVPRRAQRPGAGRIR